MSRDLVTQSLHIKIIHSSTFKKAKTIRLDGNTWSESEDIVPSCHVAYSRESNQRCKP